MLISDFNFELPDELIAQAPLDRRDASRMLVLHGEAASWEDSMFTQFPSHINPGDLVVVNNTRVFPARLTGHRIPTGGKAEIFLVRQTGEASWEALVKPGRRLKKGTTVGFIGHNAVARIGDDTTEGRKIVHFQTSEDIYTVINKIGQTPLPPYIKREEGPTTADDTRYQTIFASQRGAIAAPTAGLHFTDTVKAAVTELGGSFAEVTLHVGYGTFKPVQVETIKNHQVDPEYVVIDKHTAERINRTKAAGNRVIAIGTTTTRALEGCANPKGEVQAGSGYCNLTIVPGYQFKIIDALLTNFHLPGSSLLLLVAALAGKDVVLDAYRHAVAEHYRFYSYGDCMFVTR